MSLRSAFSALRLSSSAVSSSSRSFSSSAAVRALDAHVYVSQLSKKTTAEDLSNFLSERGITVTESRLLASEGSSTGSGILSVVSQDDVKLADVYEAITSLNLDAREGMDGLQGEFRMFLPSDSPANDLSTPSKDTVLMLNLPESITDVFAARTLVYYTAYTEARLVKLLKAQRSGSSADENEADEALPPMTRRSGMAKVTAGDEEKTKKLLSFSGQVYEGNEILVFPQLITRTDPYELWKKAEQQQEAQAEEI